MQTLLPQVTQRSFTGLINCNLNDRHRSKMDVPENNYFEMGTADCVGEPTMSRKLTLKLFNLNMKETSKPFILNEKKNQVK